MFAFFKRRAAIKWFVWRLPLELEHRFGKEIDYTIEQVDQARQKAPAAPAFGAYAHALFCSRETFEGRYGSQQESFGYRQLREKVARRFFGGTTDFNALSLYQFAALQKDDPFHESHIADHPGGHNH